MRHALVLALLGIVLILAAGVHHLVTPPMPGPSTPPVAGTPH